MRAAEGCGRSTGNPKVRQDRLLKWGPEVPLRDGLKKMPAWLETQTLRETWKPKAVS